MGKRIMIFSLTISILVLFAINLYLGNGACQETEEFIGTFVSNGYTMDAYAVYEVDKMERLKIIALYVLSALLLLGTLIFGYKLASTYQVLSADEQQIETVIQKKKQFENSDTIAWITIKGTEVNYPVMWTPDAPEYYLHRNLKGEYSYAGLPFMDYRCDLSSDNLVIYGHNMLNKTMFSQLLQYENADFRDKHSRIRLETESEVRVYTVIAAVKTYTAGFRCDSMINAVDEQEYDSFINDIKDNSLYTSDIGAEYGEQLISLSTCSYHRENGRFVVIGKLTSCKDK
jgi:SrtB family sortase